MNKKLTLLLAASFLFFSRDVSADFNKDYARGIFWGTMSACFFKATPRIAQSLFAKRGYSLAALPVHVGALGLGYFSSMSVAVPAVHYFDKGLTDSIKKANNPE